MYRRKTRACLPAHPAAGFTLMELLVVVAIVGVLSAISIPAFVRQIPKYRLKSAARELTSQLRCMRYEAVRGKKNVTMVFDTQFNCCRVKGHVVPAAGSFTRQYGNGIGFGFGAATKTAAIGSSSRLPANPITFPGNPRHVTFNSRGLSNAGSIYLCNARGDACCVVVNSAGRIRLRRWHGTRWQ